MRLIDADELIEMAYRMRLDSREQIACMIESSPTIEPEQKQGKWIRLSNYLAQCSICKDYIDNAISCGYNYCPNCGARMEE